MLTKIQEHQAKSTDLGKEDLLMASARYMQNEISMDELEQIQHVHAQDLKATVLEIEEPKQLNRLQSFIEHLCKP